MEAWGKIGGYESFEKGRGRRVPATLAAGKFVDGLHASGVIRFRDDMLALKMWAKY